jgi:hypothetical protein
MKLDLGSFLRAVRDIVARWTLPLRAWIRPTAGGAPWRRLTIPVLAADIPWTYLMATVTSLWLRKGYCEIAMGIAGPGVTVIGICAFTSQDARLHQPQERQYAVRTHGRARSWTASRGPLSLLSLPSESPEHRRSSGK